MPDLVLTTATLRTPKAAAIAGIAFSVLLSIAFVLLKISVPADPLERGAWLKTDSDTVVVALNIIPFAGIAFLWFMRRRKRAAWDPQYLLETLGPLQTKPC